MLCWNVYVGNFNDKSIELHNVFEHGGFLNGCRDAARKYKKDKAGFAEAIESELLYYYWSKCEWEVVISSWPDGKYEKKIDVYTQVMNNWEQFIDYLWAYKAELKWVDA